MHATALFPPQHRDWSLPAGVPLTCLAAERVAREACQQSFASCARSLTADWHLSETPLDGKQLERWSERLGKALVLDREARVEALACGIKPEGPANAPALVVIGLDAGCVQTREKDEQSGSRWRQDKAMSITSYLPGDGKDKPPQKLVSTYVATMENAQAFGPMAAVEAYRRGVWQSPVVLNISDAGNWIDPLASLQKLADVRIIDFYHAVEHLYEAAGAVHGRHTPEARALGAQWEGLLYEGKVGAVLTQLKAHQDALTPPPPGEGPAEPLEILRRTLGYFEKHQEHMAYDVYRARGWPIGSGNVEAGIKGFNKRVKGTDQFWTKQGVESILALRALWMSQDQRWERYWNNRPAYGLKRAA